ncbi:DUF3108 domain-containing protein [Sulfuricystis multivorans]|uniref:DUF3108 domain-containing protein n=1 Tax=Sulfuricystis multivorans TaxID=2211108 RepID=UPI001559A123|nr:DUF3108 domain-containing protein [Sulfuricystis multivorans]
MLPFWLALAASLILHVGALLAPGWSLPEEGENELPRLEATLVSAPMTPASPRAAPSAKKRPRPKAQPPAAPAASTQPQASPPAAHLPEPEPAPAAPPAPSEPEILPADTATAAPVTEPLSPAGGAVPPAPTFRDESAPGGTSSFPPAPTFRDESAPGGTSSFPPAPTFRDESAPGGTSSFPPAPTHLIRWPESGRIVYQVTRGEQGFVIGQTEQRWEWGDARYSLQTIAETTGLVALFRPVKVVQTSRGGFDAAGVRPMEFTVEREGRESERVTFEPEAGRVVFSRGGSAPFVAGAQDLLSVFFQLAGLPLDTPEYAVSVATTRKLANYQVRVDEASQLETPLGTRPVRHLTVLGRPNEDVTELWLDEQTRLPLKIRHRDRKGEVFDQVVIAIEPGFPFADTDLPR